MKRPDTSSFKIVNGFLRRSPARRPCEPASEQQKFQDVTHSGMVIGKEHAPFHRRNKTGGAGVKAALYAAGMEFRFSSTRAGAGNRGRFCQRFVKKYYCVSATIYLSGYFNLRISKAPFLSVKTLQNRQGFVSIHNRRVPKKAVLNRKRGVPAAPRKNKTGKEDPSRSIQRLLAYLPKISP